MKTRETSKGNNLFAKNGVGLMHRKTQKWISEIEFVKVEQEFLKELLSEHIIEFCNSHNIETVKELLTKIEKENELGASLLKSIHDQRLVLSLVSENIYVKKEGNFRIIQNAIKNEFESYRVNFKKIKQEVFELVLQAIKKEKQKKLLS